MSSDANPQLNRSSSERSLEDIREKADEKLEADVDVKDAVSSTHDGGSEEDFDAKVIQKEEDVAVEVCLLYFIAITFAHFSLQ